MIEEELGKEGVREVKEKISVILMDFFSVFIGKNFVAG